MLRIAMSIDNCIKRERKKILILIDTPLIPINFIKISYPLLLHMGFYRMRNFYIKKCKILY